MTQQDEASRKEFIEWYEAEMECPASFAVYKRQFNNGTFIAPEIEFAYKSWQASASRTADMLAEKDKEIGRLRSELSDYERMFIGKADGDRMAANDAYYEIADMLNVPKGGSVISTVQKLVADNQRLQQQVDVLRGYAEHAEHSEDCRVNDSSEYMGKFRGFPSAPCSCGLDAALAAADKINGGA